MMLSTDSSSKIGPAVSIKVKGLLFTGPYELEATTVRRNQAAVVYVVVDKIGEAWDPKFKVLHVGDTAGDTVEFKLHPELPTWNAMAKGKLGLYFHRPEPQQGDPAIARQTITAEISADLKDGLVV